MKTHLSIHFRHSVQGTAITLSHTIQSGNLSETAGQLRLCADFNLTSTIGTYRPRTLEADHACCNCSNEDKSGKDQASSRSNKQLQHGRCGDSTPMNERDVPEKSCERSQCHNESTRYRYANNKVRRCNLITHGVPGMAWHRWHSYLSLTCHGTSVAWQGPGS